MERLEDRMLLASIIFDTAISGSLINGNITVDVFAKSEDGPIAAAFAKVNNINVVSYKSNIISLIFKNVC